MRRRIGAAGSARRLAHRRGRRACAWREWNCCTRARGRRALEEGASVKFGGARGAAQCARLLRPLAVRDSYDERMRRLTAGRPTRPASLPFVRLFLLRLLAAAQVNPTRPGPARANPSQPNPAHTHTRTHTHQGQKPSRVSRAQPSGRTRRAQPASQPAKLASQPAGRWQPATRATGHHQHPFATSDWRRARARGSPTPLASSDAPSPAAGRRHGHTLVAAHRTQCTAAQRRQLASN